MISNYRRPFLIFLDRSPILTYVWLFLFLELWQYIAGPLTSPFPIEPFPPIMFIEIYVFWYDVIAFLKLISFGESVSFSSSSTAQWFLCRSCKHVCLRAWYSYRQKICVKVLPQSLAVQSHLSPSFLSLSFILCSRLHK